MRWVFYIIAWLAAAIFWTLAAASGASRPVLEVLPYGLLAMGSAGTMGVAIWYGSRRVPWHPYSPSFYAVHAAGLLTFSTIYAISALWPDLVRGRFGVITSFLTSPILKWNLLMGSWLYLMVAGLSYSIRAHEHIRAEERAAAEARLVAHQAQLAVLRAQLNPHFLFNALHTIGALIAADPQRADAALERLGDLLRYALRSDEHVPLGHEWKFVQDYLAFEQLRLGDRLRLDTEADARTLMFEIPPLILQPIVENAVRHGIADRDEGGHIHVSARIEHEQLVLRVQDDGDGSNADGDEGLGLSSVRRRLAALYDGRATVATDRTNGFSVTIALPIDSQGR